mgnify:CR=1 FL=1
MWFAMRLERFVRWAAAAALDRYFPARGPEPDESAEQKWWLRAVGPQPPQGFARRSLVRRRVLELFE